MCVFAQTMGQHDGSLSVTVMRPRARLASEQLPPSCPAVAVRAARVGAELTGSMTLQCMLAPLNVDIISISISDMASDTCTCCQ